MPDVRDVYEMVTRQKAQEPGALERQQKRQVRTVRNRKLGTYTLTAVLAAAAVFVLNAYDATDRAKETNEVGAQPGTIPSEPGVYLFDLETRKATRVPGIEPRSLAVSPDGTVIAYEGTDPAFGDVIFVANIDGTNARALEETATAPEDEGPFVSQFSPDGSQIVYQGMMGEFLGDLFVVDVATGETTRLTHLQLAARGTFYWMGPTFSADGQTVLFALPGGNDVEPSFDLWSVPATGGTPRRVLRDAAYGRFSPDGRTVAYFKPTPQHSAGLWLANADGTDARRLVRGDLGIAGWSPDGTRIAYIETGQGSSVVDVTTGETSKVLDDVCSAVWVDDHTWIIVVAQWTDCT